MSKTRKFDKKKFLIAIAIIILIAGSIFRIFLEFSLPSYFANIVDLIMSKSQIDNILNIGVKMLIATLLLAIVIVITRTIIYHISSLIGKKLRKKLFDKTLELSQEQLGEMGVSSLITRTTSDIEIIENTLLDLTNLMLRAPIMVVVAVIILIKKSANLTLLTSLLIFLMTFVIFLIVRKVIPMFKKIQEYEDDLNLLSKENIQGIKILRTYKSDKYQADKFSKVSNKLKEAGYFVYVRTDLISPIINLFMSLTAVLIILYGSHLINIGNVSLSDMLLFSQYSNMLIVSFLITISFFITFPRMLVSYRRYSEVIKLDKIDFSKGEEKVLIDQINTIEFKNVSFKYSTSKKMILENINFKVNQGEIIGIIGSTGSGKTTIIRLLLNLYNVNEGEILINGININNLDKNNYYEKIGYVSQKAILFKGDIRENLFINESLDDQEIKESLKTVELFEFLSSKSEFLDYEISPEGKNFSGGQKQRLNIARKIIKNPSLLIFDDSFSALDNKTDQKIRSNLLKNNHNSTKIIISQKINSILSANKILVIDNGKVESIGNHHELIESSKIYKEIVSLQLPEALE